MSFTLPVSYTAQDWDCLDPQPRLHHMPAANLSRLQFPHVKWDNSSPHSSGLLQRLYNQLCVQDRTTSTQIFSSSLSTSFCAWYADHMDYFNGLPHPVDSA